MLRAASQAKPDKDGTGGSGGFGSARADDAQREIEMQRTEIQRLRQRIDDLERQLHARGRAASRERLPPMEGFESMGATRLATPPGGVSTLGLASSSTQPIIHPHPPAEPPPVST
eukprot:TRINITY_DN9405_c0_g1_i1.p1 TRINITY_DN9405_c0_g1~~TRINITY_DN9405_c0_g1_i1.p1  ORF type:complete len:115 (+),score=28.14 TRINITY_DN9405_c0_g1_i1:111-455(+)